jgi:hypothetical protein
VILCAMSLVLFDSILFMLLILSLITSTIYSNPQNAFGKPNQSALNGNMNTVTNTSPLSSPQEQFAKPIVLANMSHLFGQSSTGSGSFPQVSHTMNNLTYVLWGKPVESGDLNKLVFLRSTNGGESFERAINVTSDNADLFQLVSRVGFNFLPRLASINDTVYVAFVNQTDIQPDKLVFVKSIDGGASFSSPVNLKIENIDFVEANGASLVTGDNNSVFIFLIGRGTETPGFSLFLKRSIDGGASFEKAVMLDKNMTHSPQAAVSENKVYIASGDGCGPILFKRSTNGGASFGTTKTILPSTDEPVCSNPSDVRLSASGSNVYLTWGSDGNVIFQRSIDGGASFEGTVVLSNSNSTNPVSSMNPAITALSNGKVCIAWENNPVFTFNNTDILLKCSYDEGSSFGKTINLSNTTFFHDLSKGILFSTVNSKHPDMSAGGNDIFIVWENYAGSVRQIMFTKSISG